MGGPQARSRYDACSGEWKPAAMVKLPANILISKSFATFVLAGQRGMGCDLWVRPPGNTGVFPEFRLAATGFGKPPSVRF